MLYCCEGYDTHVVCSSSNTTGGRIASGTCLHPLGRDYTLYCYRGHDLPSHHCCRGPVLPFPDLHLWVAHSCGDRPLLWAHLLLCQLYALCCSGCSWATSNTSSYATQGGGLHHQVLALVLKGARGRGPVVCAGRGQVTGTGLAQVSLLPPWWAFW